MPLYAPDADVLALFQRLRLEGRVIASARAPLLITDTVWDELTGQGVQEPWASKARRLLESLVTGPTVLLPATPEADTFAELHPDTSSEDAGEHSIIALAIHRPDVIPVLRDTKALVRAVEELKGRPVLSVHGFLSVRGSLPGPCALYRYRTPPCMISPSIFSDAYPIGRFGWERPWCNWRPSGG